MDTCGGQTGTGESVRTFRMYIVFATKYTIASFVAIFLDLENYFYFSATGTS